MALVIDHECDVKAGKNILEILRVCDFFLKVRDKLDEVSQGLVYEGSVALKVDFAKKLLYAVISKLNSVLPCVC